MLTTQCSSLKGVCKIAIEREQSQACLSYAKREQFGRSQRREVRRANSRGFSNPCNNDKIKKWRLQRRGTATLTTDSRLCRRHYYVVTKNRGLESPRLFIFPSFRRIFSHYSLLTAHNSKLYTPLHRGRANKAVRGLTECQSEPQRGEHSPLCDGGRGEGPGPLFTPPIPLHHHRPRPCLEWEWA